MFLTRIRRKRLMAGVLALFLGGTVARAQSTSPYPVLGASGSGQAASSRLGNPDFLPAATQSQLLTTQQVQQMIADALREERERQAKTAASTPPPLLPSANGLLPPIESDSQGATQTTPPIFPAQYGDSAGKQLPNELVGPPAQEAIPGAFQTPNYTLDFTKGVLFKTNDGLFSLRINNLVQVDYRDFTHTADGSHSPTALHDNFALPRWWVYLTGNVTEYMEYQTIFAGGAAGGIAAPSTVNVLDAYVDFNPFGQEYKELFQFRVGRMKTPYLYQFYKWSPQDFVSPELSMFSTNFLQNRQLGAMAHGMVLDKRIDYAAGIFNGSPNTFEVDFSNREGVFYLGLAPFLLEEGSALQYLNLIGSAAVGEQFGPVVPGTYSTAVPSNGPPNNALISPTFLALTTPVAGATTVHEGARALWDFEVVYSYRSFNLYAEYDAGYVTDALQKTATGKIIPGTTASVSLSGYSATATYFITGEQINNQRRYIKPLRPYSWTNGGLGAFEVYSRYSNLVIGSNIFTDKLSDPKLFANNVGAIDTGLNWYLNEYIKVMFDWQHAMFNNAISLNQTATGRTTKLEDLFWVRFQLYY